MGMKCLAQGHNTMPRVRIEPDALPTELLVKNITSKALLQKETNLGTKQVSQCYISKKDIEMCRVIGTTLLLSPKKKMSCIVRKPFFCICENKDADQLRGYREADQRLCFRYSDSTIPLLPIYEISSL